MRIADYIRPNDKEIHGLLLLAKQGDADAHCQLGRYYYMNQDVRDLERARHHYEIAAENYHAGAQNNLGSMYCYGEDVDQDYTKAVELFSKAAEQGLAEAQCNLGIMYYHSYGVDYDFARAFSLFTQASEQGITKAQFFLAKMYFAGYGVQPDVVKAAELMLASDQHQKAALKFISYIHEKLTAEVAASLSSDFSAAAKGTQTSVKQELATRLFAFMQLHATPQAQGADGPKHDGALS